MTTLEIRKAEKDDANRISILLLQLGYETTPSKIADMLSDSENGIVYVAVLDNNVVALMSIIYFTYFPSAQKLCRITSIVVDENLRGSGIGSKLIDYAKSTALADRCDVIEVTTSLKREKTQAYYESVGFKKTSYKYVQKLVPSIQDS